MGQVFIYISVVVGALLLFVFLARLIGKFRNFETNREPGPVEKVNIVFGCDVCGTEVTMTASPGDSEPVAPRHCREEMALRQTEIPAPHE